MKQTLLELAIATIDESGETGIRVSQIVESAGVTIPTLYHYFGSREGLIEEAQVERFIRALRADVDAFVVQLGSCTTRADLENALLNLITALDLPGRDKVRWQRLNAVGSTYARPDLAIRIVQAHDEVVDVAARALAPFQRQGLVRQDIDLHALIAWFNGAVIGKNLVQIATSTVDVKEWDRTFLEATSAVLFGPKSENSNLDL